MSVEAKAGPIGGRKGETVVIGMFQKQDIGESGVGSFDNRLEDYLSGIIELGDFAGKSNEISVLYPNGAALPERVIVVGLGDRASLSLESIRQASGAAARAAQGCGVSQLSVQTLGSGQGDVTAGASAQATIEGAILATYHHAKFKSKGTDRKGPLKRLTLISPSQGELESVSKGAKTGETVAAGAVLARDLSNAPGNALPPRILAERARRMSQSSGLTCSILKKRDIEGLKMGALLAVSQGSEEPPRFIVMERGKPSRKHKTLVLVGKGITFDSGGISLKPGSGMEDMKHDMSGAAAVIGAMQAIGRLKPKVHVVGLVPASENLPDGKAVKPGDVITAMSGKTIEIINTDAEGRLVLADALAYAGKYNPAAVIDLATLTGACVIALGDAASGMMGNDQEVLDRVKKAGEKSGERVWHLPLWQEYHDQIKGGTGDIKNSGGRSAGTLTAGAFLENFVDYPWVHLDIAGTAYADKASAYKPVGATGEGTRLLVQFVLDWASDSV